MREWVFENKTLFASVVFSRSTGPFDKRYQQVKAGCLFLRSGFILCINPFKKSALALFFAPFNALIRQKGLIFT